MNLLLKTRRNDYEIITTVTGKRMRLKTYRRFIANKLKELRYAKKELKTFQEEEWYTPGWEC